MISDPVRTELWQHLLDVDRMCRYYEAAYAKATRTHLLIRVSTLILITGGIAALLDLLPWPTPNTEIIFASMATVLTILDAVLNYSKRAAVAHAIYVSGTRLRVELRDLWLSVEDGMANDSEIRRRMLDLSYRYAELEGWAGANDLTPDKNLNEEITQDAYQVVRGRHDAGSENA